MVEYEIHKSKNGEHFSEKIPTIVNSNLTIENRAGIDLNFEVAKTENAVTITISKASETSIPWWRRIF